MPYAVTITNASGSSYRGKALMMASIEKALRGRKVRNATVDVILMSDADVRALNKTYLNHDYETDVITFALEENKVEGEIYISIDTARRQATDYGVTLTNELCRLAVHGTLHLCGLDDATDADRAAMAQLEDRYIVQSL
jgi:probable rRNA maturation factor